MIDEFVLYLAPIFIGSPARGILDRTPLTRLADASRLTVTDTRLIGKDLRIIARPQ